MKVFIKSIIIFFISYHNLNAKSSWNKKYVQNKNGLIYVPTSKLPYTGEVFSLDDNGNITVIEEFDIDTDVFYMQQIGNFD